MEFRSATNHAIFDVGDDHRAVIGASGRHDVASDEAALSCASAGIAPRLPRTLRTSPGDRGSSWRTACAREKHAPSMSISQTLFCSPCVRESASDRVSNDDRSWNKQVLVRSASTERMSRSKPRAEPAEKMEDFPNIAQSIGVVHNGMALAWKKSKSSLARGLS